MSRHIYPCPFNSWTECTRKPGAERCGKCGFNPYVAAFRHGKIEAGGMKKDADGLKRLHVIKTKEEEET